jgi:hypothetical protein
MLRPTADTAEADWTPSAGADHYAMVDEATINGDTDYVSADISGDLDLYEMANLTRYGARRAGHHGGTRKDDAKARQVRTKLKSGTISADGTAQGMATSYLPYADLHETDPGTAMAWTPSGVTAMQVGNEVVS